MGFWRLLLKMKQRTYFANWLGAKYFSQKVIAIVPTLTIRVESQTDPGESTYNTVFLDTVQIIF